MDGSSRQIGSTGNPEAQAPFHRERLLRVLAGMSPRFEGAQGCEGYAWLMIVSGFDLGLAHDAVHTVPYALDPVLGLVGGERKLLQDHVGVPARPQRARRNDRLADFEFMDHGRLHEATNQPLVS